MSLQSPRLCPWRWEGSGGLKQYPTYPFSFFFAEHNLCYLKFGVIDLFLQNEFRTDQLQSVGLNSFSLSLSHLFLQSIWRKLTIFDTHKPSFCKIHWIYIINPVHLTYNLPILTYKPLTKQVLFSTPGGFHYLIIILLCWLFECTLVEPMNNWIQMEKPSVKGKRLLLLCLGYDLQ